MVIADTGFWLALANRRDSYHHRAKDALAKIHAPLITTWPVMTETCHLLAHRLGQKSVLLFLESFSQKAFHIFELKPEYTPRLIRLMKKYADLPMDLADASLVLLAEELGQGTILSTDERDFGAYRFKNHKPFQNLLAEPKNGS